MSSDLPNIFKTITNKFKDLFSRVSQLEAEPKFIIGGGGGGAPADAAYLVLGYDALLTAERLFSVAGGASAVDSGADNTYIVTVHDAVTLGGGNYGALTLAGQALTLGKAQLDADYINEGQAAAGDLGGTYPNPTVTWTGGYATFDARYLMLDASNDPLTGNLTINVNSLSALVVEQSGVKDDVLVVDTTNGRVGIGTPTPQEQLHIYSATGLVAEIEANSANLVRMKLTRTDGSFSVTLGADVLQIYDHIDNLTRATWDGDGNYGVGANGSPSYRLSVFSANNADQVGIYHDNSNARFTTTDGFFIFMTDEGVNSSSIVEIKGKGTGFGILNIYDEDEAEFLQTYISNGIAYIQTVGAAPGAIDFQYSASAGVNLFQGAGSGETQELTISGFRAADALRSLEIGVGVDAADTASFDGLSAYLFDGDVLSSRLAVGALADLSSNTRLVDIYGTTSSAAHNYGVALGTRIGANATSITGLAISLFSQTFTADFAYGIQIYTPTEGAVPGIDTNYGLYIHDQLVGEAANYAIYTNNGDIRFGGSVLIDCNEADALLVEQNGVHDNVLVVNTSLGRVGIGTATIDTELHIEFDSPTLLIEANNGGARIDLEKSALDESSIITFGTIGGPLWFVGTTDSDIVGAGTEFYIGSVLGGTGNNIYISPTGDVGINYTALTYDFMIGSADRSDYVAIVHDNTDAWIRWNDGSLILKTSEASPADTYVEIKGSLAGEGYLLIYNSAETSWLEEYVAATLGHISVQGAGGSLNFQYNATGDVVCFVSSGAGDTKEFWVYGQRAAGSFTGVAIGCGIDVDRYASFDGNANLLGFMFDGKVLVNGLVAPSYSLSIASTDSSDQVGIYHDNTNAYFAWDDGSLYLQSEEGGIAGTVNIRGLAATDRGNLVIHSEDSTETLTMTTIGGYSYITNTGSAPIGLILNYSAESDVFVFSSSASGETKELRIYGFRAADALRAMQIGVGIDAADTASFDGVSNYLFDGNVILNLDNQQLQLGTGRDVGIYYDGTDAFIVTDLVAASDLIVDCGTNKTIELAEVVYDDQQVNLGAVGLGSSAPTWTAYKGSEVLAFNKAQDNLINFTIQFSHKLKQSTDVDFHVHTTVPDNTAGDVRWVLTVSFADIGGTFPGETTTSIEQTIVINSLDDHLYFDVASAIANSSSVSGICLCSLMREGSHVNDDYDNDIYLLALDAHIQIDTMGSRQETVK